MVSVAIETPLQDEVTALLEKSDAYGDALYPPDARFGVDITVLVQPNVRFHVARYDGRAIGCGALVIKGEGQGELKRMFVDESARGKGAGRALLQAIESTAAGEGIELIQLETGPYNTEALGLYRRLGFVQRGPFGSYADHPMSIFMEKNLNVDVGTCDS
jgi:putative acetyltransferase